MRILFTPAGDTDPVRGFRDGAILHILRYYPVDKVILFLTKEMEEKENLMQCYSKGIRSVTPKCDIAIIKSGITEPQDFEKLTAIQNEFDKAYSDENHVGAEWLLNISSGTPQIKSVMSLLALDYPQAKAIQVNSPEGKSNRRNNPCTTAEELIEMLECNEDNEPEALNRTSEPPLMLLKKHGLKMQVASLIKNYEYAGAFQLVKLNNTLFSDITRCLLEHAVLRKDLMWREANKKIKAYNGNTLIETADDFSEYFQVMEMYQRKKQLSEFILRISPLLLEIGVYYLGKLKQFRLEGCGKQKSGNKDFIIRRKNMYDNYPEIVEYIEKQLKSYLRDSSLNFNLVLLICNYYKEHELNGDEKHEIICQKFNWLREVEKNVRNVTAHSITNVTEDKLRSMLQKDSKGILAELHTVIKLVHGNDIAWSYDRLNQYIMDSLRE